MPPYLLSKTGIVTAAGQAVPGLPFYLFGSLNRLVAPTRISISTLSCNGTTGTVTGLVIEGQIPTVGQLVSIAGAVPSYFNVTNAKILSVSAAATPDLGIYTITFALANTFVPPLTVSPGIAVAPQIEIGDTLALNNGSTATPNAMASVAAALQSNINPANGRSVRFDVSFPTLPGAVTVAAQSAYEDLDSEYQYLGGSLAAATVASVTGSVLTGGSVIFNGVTAEYVRLIVSGLAANGTIVGIVMI